MKCPICRASNYQTERCIDGITRCFECLYEAKTGNWVKWNADHNADFGYNNKDLMIREPVDDGSKYRKNIRGADVDIYDILKAFDVTNSAVQHAIKKLLAGGKRGHKDVITDLKEARWSIGRAIELEDEDEA